MPTTSPDNFFYPSDSSNNDLTQHVKDLADDVQAKFTAQNTWNSWTPQFYIPANGGTDGGIQAVGSGGHASGYYRRSAPGSGALVQAEFRFLLGTSPTIVAGTFVLILPVIAYEWGGTTNACRNQTVGQWTLRDTSSSPANHYAGTLALFGDAEGNWVHFTGVPGVNAATSDDSSRYRMDSNDPITYAVDDILTGNLFYRAN